VTRFIDGSGPVFAGPVFPFCFITIACGAVSGFHAIVASGTTPKLLAREGDIRTIGYGAMLAEMCVGVMAVVAACSMQPGEYFAINMKGDVAEVTRHVTALGFAVTPADMAAVASSVGERTMVGRAGGAPTFALGMAQTLSGVFRGGAALAVFLVAARTRMWLTGFGELGWWLLIGCVVYAALEVFRHSRSY